MLFFVHCQNLIPQKPCYYIFSYTCDIREKTLNPVSITALLQHKTPKKERKYLPNQWKFLIQFFLMIYEHLWISYT